MGLAKKSIFAPIVFTLLFVSIVIIGLSSSNSSFFKKEGESSLSLDSESSSFSLDDLDLQFESEYGVVTPHDLYTYKHIVEPYKAMTLGFNMELPQRYSVTWQIDDVEGSLKGSSTTHAFTTPNKVYEVVASITDLDGEVVKELKAEAACKYVRRELRTLTDDDREAFFTALETVYNTEQGEGENLYGNKFVNIKELVKNHLDGAGRMECDHWHDDAGILTHHVAYTLQMEQSLQSVNPSVAMPYWDHTVDAALYGDDYKDSPIFDPAWFGEADPKNHNISSGRWAGLSVSQPVDDFDIYNAYGHMRSPWNNNPSAYVGRSGSVHGNSATFSMPSCAVFSDCFNHDTLSDINNCMNGATHGPVHIKIGGAWGLTSTFLYDYFPTSLPDLVLLFKLLWRHGYARCPTSCSSDTPAANCTCSVPDEYFDTYGAYTMLDDVNMFTYLAQGNTKLYQGEDGKYHYRGVSEEDEETFFNELIQNLANPGITGEMYTSAAPWDPTFWPLHPTAERLVQYRVYLSMKKEMYLNTTWGYTHDSSIPSDDQSYCNWTSVEGLDLPECYTVEYCPGHEADAVLPFTNFLDKGETYTNEEFLSFMGPTNTERPYIYDNYDYSFCEGVGDPIYTKPTEETSAKASLRKNGSR
jgi:phage-related protein